MPGLFAIALQGQRTPVVVWLDSAGEGRVFEGLGAVSAGASSRLLIDYPEPQRSEVLDYLFKPGYGAALQHLKVEIGADVNSTDGAEPSHERTASDHSADRGYEWWLMKEARRRNPKITLDSLAWGAPGWIGQGKYYSHDMAVSIADFLVMAREKHGLEIAYTGVWNERKPDYAFVKDLRATLDRRGLKTQIVCCDLHAKQGMFDIFDAMKSDSQLADAVAVVGVHYPFEGSAEVTPKHARESGRRMWSSEDQPNSGSGPFLTRDWNNGGRLLAKRYNENYVKGRLTKTEIWSPVTAYYDLLAAPHSGLMVANTPWSGAYEVPSSIWVTAHTTQFVQPGWRYMDGASGMLPEGQGSYVALRSPDSNDAQWSVVVETVDAKSPQRIEFKVKPGFATHSISVWETNSRRSFEKVATVALRNGGFSYTFEPDAIYTLTTTIGQHKGTALPPRAGAFPMPYADDIEKGAIGSPVRYMADQDGAFEIQSCTGRGGHCMRQVITQRPTPWGPLPDPFTLAGDAEQADYTVRADLRIADGGSECLMSRVDSADVFRDGKARYPAGYIFSVEASGRWTLLSTAYKEATKVLASGDTVARGGQWQHMELKADGDVISASMNGIPLAKVVDTTHRHGMFGYGTGWNVAEFDNLSVTR